MDGGSSNDIAIVGIAAHLPGAQNPPEFWRNLREGVESIRSLTDDELLGAGVPTDVLHTPGYVKSAAILDGTYDFDAEFFGFSPKEAGVMDPQHRHFLMAAWEALEDAGHIPESFDGAIGVFAGCGTNSYYVNNVLTNRDLVREVGLFLLRHTGNDKDFLSTRASYVFDLRGTSVNVQTACSTSLVATHLAAQHLLSGEVDLALAGGVTIEVPHGHGYQYHEGEVLSPDGHCRAFDHRAQGTVFGSGVGVVALRRLDDAIADGDQIYAVIKGTAVNNDGAQKVGYLAPSVDGQATCVAEALAVAGVEPETVSYVECHGTGTPMGDPIEIAALTQAFRTGGDKSGYCGIGSVKTNIGHLDTAAGVASLIKVALAMRNEALPPSLNFEAANPLLELDGSPFVVNHRLAEWRREGSERRRAAVNSLGVGGTNAFAVLEEAPTVDAEPSPERWRLLVLSARNRGALDAASSRLAAHLREHPDVDLGDVGWTLRNGRRQFAERRVVAIRDAAGAAELLEARDPRRVFTHAAHGGNRRIALMFPGGGAQHLGMGAGLARAEPVFARVLDEGFELLERDHGLHVRDFVLGTDFADREQAEDEFELMRHQLPAIFLVEYAMATLLEHYGVEFDALVGHSVGENTAACVAGTMSFADCLGLVVLRGTLMDRVGGGAVAVPLPPDELTSLLDELELDLAVINAPDLSVVSGALGKLAVLEARLRELGTEAQRVRLNVAPHSRELDPILPEFRAYLDGITLSPPRIPWVSNTTGTWVTPEQAVDPGYWVEHLRSPVHFVGCVTTLAAEPGRVLLEAGPGKTLSTLARMNPEMKATQSAIPTMRHADEDVDDEAFLLTAAGRLWATGCELPAALEARLFDDDGQQHRRVALPTYSFQTQRFFIPPGVGVTPEQSTTYVDRDADETSWFWAPVWKSQDRDEPETGPLSWMVFVDAPGPGPDIGSDVVKRLRARGDGVTVVKSGDSFQAISDSEYVVAPENGLADYTRLIREVVRTGRVPDRVAHLALVSSDGLQYRPGSSFFHRNLELGFQSLVHLAQAWSAAGVARPLHIAVATMCSQRVVPSDLVQWPEQATVLGPARVIPREFGDVTVTAFDIDQRDLFRDSRLRARLDVVADIAADARRSGLTTAMRTRASGRAIERLENPLLGRREALLDSIVGELLAPAANAVVALRRDRRFVLDVRRIDAPDAATGTAAPMLRHGGAVLITGGLGGIGLTIADHLWERSAARLALMSRSPLPRRDEWDEVVARLGANHATSQRIAGVRALESRGVEVLLLHGDVTDLEQMREITAAVRNRFGSIDGVVHAAGVVDDNLLVAKSVSEMDDVLAPKVYGTLVLDEATRADTLDHFTVFSSTSTVTAPIGQVDYVAANAFLNSWAESRRVIGRDEVVALDWGVWNEVGMAAAALHRGEHAAHDGPTGEARPARHPWFDSVDVDRRGVARVASRWHTEHTWFLDDHRLASGESLFPGAGYFELVRAALAEIGVVRPFELRELTCLRPLDAPDDGHVDVQTVLTPTEAGYDVTVRQAVVVGAATAEDGVADGRPGWLNVAEGAVHLGALDEAEPVDIAAVEADSPERDPVRTQQQNHLRFGPRWDVVRRVQRGERRAVAWLDLADGFAGDLDHVALHPALVDLGTGFAMNLIDGYTGSDLWVPLSYRAVRVYGPLPQRVVAVATIRPGSSEGRGFARFDVALCDEDGTVLVDVREFTIKRLSGTLELGLGRTPTAAEAEFDVVAAHVGRPLSQAELALRHNVSQGIVPDEGKRTFALALATGRPVVYVSSMDLVALRAQAESAADAQAGAGTPSAVSFGRPDLGSDYLAPRDDREETLVAIWQELLGVNEIGVLDSFFDLGGHSLIAVRLFARLKRVFSVEFPISVLFEAPTIEAIAQRIAAATTVPSTGAEAASGDDGEATVTPHANRFSHLVAMHAGEGGPKTPFFLVAGMYGNVLNLRHIAHLVGTDRPFYGVQARGLFGDAEPHATFEEMAHDYLGEVRTVQPHGPYLLGGFSGGGIAAYEMAQQLLAEGEEVGLLVFLDTPLPKSDPLTLADKVKLQRSFLSQNGPKYLADWAVNRVKWEFEKRDRTRWDAPAEAGAMHSERIGAAFWRALDRYQAKAYRGRITLYRPKLTPFHVLGPDRMIGEGRRFIYHDNGWGRFAESGVDVTEVPGDHSGMVLEPNVRVLAAHLRTAIDSAD